MSKSNKSNDGSRSSDNSRSNNNSKSSDGWRDDQKEWSFEVCPQVRQRLELTLVS